MSSAKFLSFIFTKKKKSGKMFVDKRDVRSKQTDYKWRTELAFTRLKSVISTHLYALINLCILHKVKISGSQRMFIAIVIDQKLKFRNGLLSKRE